MRTALNEALSRTSGAERGWHPFLGFNPKPEAFGFAGLGCVVPSASTMFVWIAGTPGAEDEHQGP